MWPWGRSKTTAVLANQLALSEAAAAGRVKFVSPVPELQVLVRAGAYRAITPAMAAAHNAQAIFQWVAIGENLLASTDAGKLTINGGKGGDLSLTRKEAECVRDWLASQLDGRS